MESLSSGDFGVIIDIQTYDQIPAQTKKGAATCPGPYKM